MVPGGIGSSERFVVTKDSSESCGGPGLTHLQGRSRHSQLNSRFSGGRPTPGVIFGHSGSHRVGPDHREEACGRSAMSGQTPDGDHSLQRSCCLSTWPLWIELKPPVPGPTLLHFHYFILFCNFNYILSDILKNHR